MTYIWVVRHFQVAGLNFARCRRSFCAISHNHGETSAAGECLSFTSCSLISFGPPMTNATLPAATDLDLAPSIAERAPAERRSLAFTSLRRLPEVEHLVDGFVASWHSGVASIQARRWHRIPFARRLTITPLDDSAHGPSGESFTVTGREISLVGVSFTHTRPLAARHVAVTFHLADGTTESVVTRLRWCRFRRDGVYLSGGQFLHSIATQG
jgi:hypothetical protein